MSDLPDFGFAPPPFQADQALQQLQRAMRDLKLQARGSAFELRGKRVVELQLDAGGVQAKLARKLAMTPEFDRVTVSDTAAQRKLIDEVKRRLARWDHED